MSCRDDTFGADLTYVVLAGRRSSGNSCFSVKTQILTADVFPQANSLNRFIRDTVSTAETVAFRITKAVVETVEVAESDFIIFLNDKAFVDTLGFVEQFVPLMDWHRAFADTTAVAEAVSIQFSPGAYDDSVVVQEQVTRFLRKVFADSITLVEAFRTGGNQSFADTGSAVEHGSLLNQGYFDHTGNPSGYFADDYFGDKRTW